ncbi:MAG: glycosyltransferase family 9 protein [Parachlamydiales bacterium]|nr:glycosyltransferase family 9 protein [Parachlamydiales bacterium]
MLKKSRFYSKLALLPLIWWNRCRFWVKRDYPKYPKKILIAHHLLLGDQLMLTALIAKIRSIYPFAKIYLFTSEAAAPLYEKRPYDVIPIVVDPKNPLSLLKTLKYKGFDLALIPGDNRVGKTAFALGANHIRALEKDAPEYKNRYIDELVRWPTNPTALPEIFSSLIPGNLPDSFSSKDWSAPAFKPFELPDSPYAVLHVGCSTPLKQWEADKWHQIAHYLVSKGINPIWSGGPNEQAIVDRIDPMQLYTSFAEKLDLCQLWHLIQNAKMVICPDTSISHLSRIIGTKVITLFGPASAFISGPGQFWKNSQSLEITINNFFCRNQATLFRREIPWVLRCNRTVEECPEPLCMQAIHPQSVKDSIDKFIK